MDCTVTSLTLLTTNESCITRYVDATRRCALLQLRRGGIHCQIRAHSASAEPLHDLVGRGGNSLVAFVAELDQAVGKIKQLAMKQLTRLILWRPWYPLELECVSGRNLR